MTHRTSTASPTAAPHAWPPAPDAEPLAPARSGQRLTSGPVGARSGLTAQQMTIACLVGRHAMTNQQVATRLFLSPHTVNYHLRRIFRELGITSRVQLAGLTHLWTDR